jgi:putative flippase GtrA
VREHLRGPEGIKMLRYSMASVVSLVVSVICLAIFVGPIGMRAWLGATLATAIASVPSYYLNRRWAWGKSGKSHFMKEVVPFWGLAFLGWGFSTLCVHLMEDYADHHRYSHLLKTGTVTLVYVAAFGVFWVVKYVIFNKLVFVHHGEPKVDAVAGAVGAPAMMGRVEG